MERLQLQMATLNKAARDVMVKYPVHGCTDVTGFSLMGHSYEMAQGSGCTLHIQTQRVPFHPEATEMAEMGFIPAGAYRNREYAGAGVLVAGDVSRAMQDILYDPQTSGGLLISVPKEDGLRMLEEMHTVVPDAAMIGYVTEKEDADIVLE